MKSVSFRALVAEQSEAAIALNIRTLTEEELPKGDLLIRVAYSSVNYKDALACQPDSKIVSRYPFVPGIDCAGTVASSDSPQFQEGDRVIVTGYGLGVSQFGGFSEYVRVPADWAVALPDPLSLREAMAFGTAGFTAALSLLRLEQNDLHPEAGPVLVTGATGGVGSIAVRLLALSGYDVHASTGKPEEHAYLQSLGASQVLDRRELQVPPTGPLAKQRWAAAIDPVGGDTLATILASIRYGGSVAVSGMTGGTTFAASVYPYILRGVNLLGIDSVQCPHPVRKQLWQRIAEQAAGDPLIGSLAEDITLDELPQKLQDIANGRMRGRAVVRL